PPSPKGRPWTTCSPKTSTWTKWPSAATTSNASTSSPSTTSWACANHLFRPVNVGGRAGRPPLSAAGARRAHWGGSSPPPRTGPPATSPRPSPCGVFVFSLEVRHLHHVADLPTTLSRGITPASGDFSTRVFSPRSSDRASSPTGLPLQQHVLLSPAGSRSVRNRYTPTCPLQHGTSFRRIRTWSEQSA